MASIQEDIDKALGAHALWKMRLRTAIHKGQLDIAASEIARDDRCEFGRWLRGATIPKEAKASKHFAVVVRLHSEFHRVAAQIAELAIAGRKDEASKLLNSGEYARTSDGLAQAMEAWRDGG
jgi:hypothetical protein